MGLFKGDGSFLRDRLDKRIELASHRKWSFMAIALIVLAIMCNGALSLILSGIGLIIKGIGTVILTVASVISAVATLISSNIVIILKWLFSVFLWTYKILLILKSWTISFCKWVWSKLFT